MLRAASLMMHRGGHHSPRYTIGVDDTAAEDGGTHVAVLYILDGDQALDEYTMVVHMLPMNASDVLQEALNILANPSEPTG